MVTPRWQAPKLKIIAQRPEGKQSKVSLKHPSRLNTRVVELERPNLEVPFGLDLKIIKEKDLFGYGSIVTVKTLTPDGLAATAGLHTVSSRPGQAYVTNPADCTSQPPPCVSRPVAAGAASDGHMYMNSASVDY